ncbi:hypothetical protein GCM10020216_039940 [Nonomuraea helvata]
MDEASARHGDSQSHVRGADRRGRPIRLTVRGVDDHLCPEGADQLIDILASAHIERQPLKTGGLSRPGQIRRSNLVPCRQALSSQLTAEKATTADDEDSHGRSP